MIKRIYRVLRGGSWYDDPGPLRASSRGRCGPDYRLIHSGFRLVVRIKDE